MRSETPRAVKPVSAVGATSAVEICAAGLVLVAESVIGQTVSLGMCGKLLPS
jgi:hypothetical protein